MKRLRRSTSENISRLPNNVIENILMCLPVRDAVRTSILSRKWRHYWKNIPELVFDNTFGQILTKNLVSTRHKLFINIYQVVLVHNAPILKFTLSIPGLESCPEIDQLMIFLSRQNIQEFTLHIWGDDRYKLHSCLFSYLHLTHLNLRSCVFKPPTTFEGFSSLISLEFSKVHLAAEFFINFISSCPLLERLVLESYTKCHLIEINAPKLKLFNFHGNFNSLYFKNTPLLSRVSIASYTNSSTEFEKQNTSNMIEVFHSLPMIENLQAGYHFLKFMAVGDVPKLLPTPLYHLKVLELPDICFTEMDEVSCALCLISSAPNLQKIKIEVSECSISVLINPVTRLLEAEDYSNLSLNQLQQVEILSVKGTKPEMDFIKFLLAKSPDLEKMFIRPPPGTDDRQRLLILKEVTRFCRASPIAEIIYLDPNDEDDQA